MNISECRLSPKEQTIANTIALTALRLELIADRLVFKPLGVTSSSFRILAILDHFGQVSPGEIVDLVGASKSNLTQRLDFLVRAGLVERKVGGLQDRRKITINLTVAGKKKVKETLKILKQVNAHLESNFSETERQNFFSFAKKLNASIDYHANQEK